MKSRKQIVSGNEIKTLRRPFIKELFRNNKFNLVMTVFVALLGSLISLGISWLIKQISDLISDECPYNLSTLLIVVVSTLLMALMAWVIETIFVSEFRSKSIKQYKEYVFSQLMKKGIQSFSKENSSLYISALSNDVNTIERDFIGQLQSIIQTAITFIGALFLMFWYSPLLTLVSIGFSFIPIIVALILGNKAEKEEQNVSDKKAKYTGMLKDALTGFSVIKSFGAEKNMISLHNSSNENVANAHKKRIKVDMMVEFSSGISGCILQFGVFFVAAALALSGKGVTAGTAIVFVQLLNYILAPIQSFPTFFAGVKSSLGLISKLANALNENVPNDGKEISPVLNSKILIQNLSFAYEENKMVLEDINMEINKGGCYAIVGASGCGKSTILNLLMASSKDYNGNIFYDDNELKNISSNSLYNLVSIIQQNVFVFNNTIRDNITMFSNFDEDEIERAVNLSGLKRLIEDKGTDYLCGENGSGLSGGERQRISIARALLRKTPVLFIDEATASLDAKTSFEVLDAILNLDGYTRIIVTHDLDENILKRCTGIFALKNGIVSEQGTFNELMNKKEYFYSLYTISKNDN